jgi:hypothetical protein
VERIRSLPKVRILDDSPRMLLVEGPERNLTNLVASMPDWIMGPELNYDVTLPHAKVR